MVKSRMTTADVAAQVSCLKHRLIGMRLSNVYDLTAKVFTLKLARSGEEGEKVILVLESGTRFHTTEVKTDRASNDFPGNFTMKLRKHLRSKRLNEIRQLGMDRIVDFVFGAGEGEHHLILELYASGNVVLTDREYVVLSLLRTHRDDDKLFALMPGHPYPVHACRLRSPAALDDLRALLEPLEEGQEDKRTLRTVLNDWIPYGPALCDHLLVQCGLKGISNKPIAEAGVDEDKQRALMEAVCGLEGWFDSLDEGPPPQGFVCTKPSKLQNADSEPLEIYEEYGPMVLAQHSQMRALPFPTFDAALSAFYERIDVQKAEQQQLQQEHQAMQKLQRVREDQTKRVEGLAKEVEKQEHRAMLIHLNLEAVDAAIAAVNGALASGLDWQELEQMVKDERKAGNPVAGLIGSMALGRNKITLMLPEPDEEDSDESSSEDDDEEEEVEEEERRKCKQPGKKKKKAVADVEVDLSMSAHANASVHHTLRKKHEEKHRRTLEANQSTFKAAEKKALTQVQQLKSTATIRTMRKVTWFEKFHWFVSSENFLVITGRDAQQNEILVKRFLRRGDIYVHADLHGASTTIIKNPRPDEPVPPLTLNQAGCAAVCRSRAWEAKIVTSAWWVHHHQVSKTAPTGEYLTTGSFMVRGKKNFLPPSQLVMGFGLMFKVDESCVAAHSGERAVRGGGWGPQDDAASGNTGAVSVLDVALLEAEDTNTTASVPDSPMDDSIVSSAAFPAAASSGGLGDNDHAEEEEQEDEEEDDDDNDDDEEEEEQDGGSGEEEGEEEEEEEPKEEEESGGATELDDFMDGLGVGVSSLLSPGDVTRAAGHQQHEAGPQRTTEASGSDSPSGGGGGAGGARHLSAKQRRQMKKAGTKVAVPLSEQPQPEAEQGAAKKEAQGNGAPAGEQDAMKAAIAEARAAEAKRKADKAAAGAAVAAAKAAQQRGKKAKAKKIKDKYADQDDEDRELAMQVLASAGDKVQRRQARKEKKAARKITSEVPQPELPDGMTPAQLAFKISRREEEPAAADADVAADDDDAAEETAALAAVPSEGEDAAHAVDSSASAAPGGEEEEEKASTLRPSPAADGPQADDTPAAGTEAAEEGDDEEEEAATSTQPHDDLDPFTGIPLPDDLLVFAMPVCAPYSALTGYKYRVKLTPGRQKKGKAARSAMEMLLRGTAEVSAREKELMKAVTDAEMVGPMVGPVQVSMPGLAQAKVAQRKAKKGK